MLRANVDLSDCKRRLDTHRKTLQSIGHLKNDHMLATKLLRDCHTFVADALKTSTGAQKKVEEDLIKVVQSEVQSKKKPKATVEDAPSSLVVALQGCGITLPDDAQRAIRLFENELLLDHLKKGTYIALLSQLAELLEEEL